MIECAVLLEARIPERNIFRSYYVAAIRDIFNRLFIEVIHGRIGVKGKRTTYHVNSRGEAIYFMSMFLKKRETSFTRFGAHYCLRHKVGTWDIDEMLFPFRQNLLFEEKITPARSKKPSELIRYGEGLFCYDLPSG